MENSRASAFLEVSKSDNNILPRSIISPMIDKQSAVIAMNFFSQEVQDKMVEIEELKEYVESQKEPKDRQKIVKTSYFVKCIWEWYEACDSRGLDLHTRIEMLHVFDKLRRQNVDFSSFPPPGGYVKGIPIVCYEGILVNNCLHIQLYNLCKGRKYNSRSFSTLNVENLFGDMTAMEFSGLGCPKSTDIFCLMSHGMQMMFHHLDATR